MLRPYTPFRGEQYRIGLNARSHDGWAIIWLACAPARLDIPYTCNNILIPPALSQFIGDLGGYDPESFSKRTSCEQGIPDQVRDEDFYSLFLDAEWNNKITA